MRCHLCGEASAVAVRTLPSLQTGAPYTLKRCGACGSEGFDLGEHPVDLAALYDAEDPAPEYVRFRRQRYWGAEVARIERLHHGPVRSVLDIGCRTGDFLLHWPADRRRVGVELSEKNAAVAVARGLEVVQRPIEEYAPAERFDAITLYAVLEHLPDPRAMLARFPALTRPGAVATIMVPTHESGKRRLLDAAGRRWHMYNPPLHLSFPSRRWLDAAMGELGFRLASRRWTSGGMFNPLRRVPLLAGAWSRAMHLADTHGPLCRTPLFDHLYSYYVRTGE
jgi:SAM-dependent methyltransferase